MDRCIRKHLRRGLLWALTLLLMAAIFGFSGQSGEESGGLSAYIAEPLTNLVAELRGGLTPGERAELYLQVDGLVRTAAHFAEYCLLGALVRLLMADYGLKAWYLPVMAVAVYALTDELHQAAVPGRVCDAADLLVDTLGAACGVLMTIMINRFRRNQHVHDC